MKKILEIGSHYVSDFIKSDTDYDGKNKYSLDLQIEEVTGAVRLIEDAPNETMWGKYWYRSGINATMTKELGNIVNEICSRIKYKKDDVWLDIACNDGTMMRQIPNEFIKLGIDPCDDTFYNESSKYGTVIQDYFSYDAYQKTGYGDKKAKVITTIAMFYDLSDPHPFINDINEILADDGVWVLQLSYTPLMVKQLAFDNICHEHRYYYSLKTIKNLFAKHNLKVVDCELNDVNGGSFRVYVQKDNAPITSFGTSPLRDVCQFRMESILSLEEKFDVESPEVWEQFQKDIDALKEQTVAFIKEEVAKGKTVYGYGASTKGNTLLQYFGLDSSLISAMVERSPYKFGLKTIGTNIPIISEEEMRQSPPDYMLVLPWHFINEFVSREQDYLNNGGQFIVPCPRFEIIGGK
jgi:NDP-4-keto-2,6-dideoxyhexose 3-C-methyltransferase